MTKTGLDWSVCCKYSVVLWAIVCVRVVKPFLSKYQVRQFQNLAKWDCSVSFDFGRIACECFLLNRFHENQNQTIGLAHDLSNLAKCPRFCRVNNYIEFTRLFASQMPCDYRTENFHSPIEMNRGTKHWKPQYSLDYFYGIEGFAETWIGHLIWVVWCNDHWESGV